VTLRCLVFGHEPGAAPVVRDGRVHWQCMRCLRLSPPSAALTAPVAAPPVVHDSRQVLRLVKKQKRA
jgi:hypothetical protein